MKTAGMAVSAALFLMTAALAADLNRVQITRHGQEVEIAAPETGILQLQTRPDISSGTWLGTGWPVKTQSLIRTMQRQREFARVEMLTDKDVDITDNAQMMIDAGRNVFRFETFGDELFSGKATCNRCHSEPLWTEPGWNLHTAVEIGIDDFEANRAPDKRYRTAPLAGIFSRPKGGFYHDGRFATLLDVVKHYNAALSLNLTDQEENDLVEYLKSL